MDGSFLRFYVEEKQRHHGVLLWEWLLAEAKQLGVPGGSAFRTIGGFGRRHAVHEDRFFELAGSAGIEVEFLADEKTIALLLERVRATGFRVFYSRLPAYFGVINPDGVDTPAAYPEDSNPP